MKKHYNLLLGCACLLSLNASTLAMDSEEIFDDFEEGNFYPSNTIQIIEDKEDFSPLLKLTEYQENVLREFDLDSKSLPVKKLSAYLGDMKAFFEEAKKLTPYLGNWVYKGNIFDQLVETSPTRLRSVVDAIIQLKTKTLANINVEKTIDELKKIPQHKIEQTVKGIVEFDSNYFNKMPNINSRDYADFFEPFSFVPLGKMETFLDRFINLPFYHEPSEFVFLSNLEESSFNSIVSMGKFYEELGLSDFWSTVSVGFFIKLMTILPDENKRNSALETLKVLIKNGKEGIADNLMREDGPLLFLVSLQGDYRKKMDLYRYKAEKLNQGIQYEPLNSYRSFEDYWNNVFFEDMCDSFREYNKSSLSNQEIMKTLFPKVEEWNVPSITEAQDKFYELAKSGRPYAKLFNPEPNFFTYEDYFMHVMLPQISDSFREYNKSSLSNQKIMKTLFPKVKEGEVPSIPMAQDKFYELAKSGRPYARIFLSGPYGLPEGY